jgi:two-component system sensor histidine kinase KdpD
LSTPTEPPTEPVQANGSGPEQPRGKLKVFLGYAAGVGKTCRMLEEGHHLLEGGCDVIVGYFEGHGRKDTVAKSLGLETIPRRTIPYRSTTFQEMDTPAILQRRPAICLVDELAHSNVPGSEREKRWEDVQILLSAGINVLTTVNIQHLESLNDEVFQISGVRVRETVPDWFVKSADEVIMIDATSGALLNRLKRGDIYAPEKTQQAMENFFKESTLAALRELALRHTAHELESRQKEGSRQSFKCKPHPPNGQQSLPTETNAQDHDKILIYLTPDSSTARLIRRGRKMADYLDADCFAVCVSPKKDFADAPAEQRDAMEKHLNFAKNLRIDTHVLEGTKAAQSLVEFARRNEVTQILLARPRCTWWNDLLGTDLVLQVIEEAKDIRVIVVADRAKQ